MTLAIMAVLAMVAVPMVQLTVQRQKEQELRLALREIRQAIDAYKRASEQGRIAKKLGQSGYPESLRELVDGVDDQRSPTKKKIFFLRRMPRDPMSADTEAKAELSWNLRSYESAADDPKPGDDVFDVMSKSDKKGLNGIPYNEW